MNSSNEFNDDSSNVRDITASEIKIIEASRQIRQMILQARKNNHNYFTSMLDPDSFDLFFNYYHNHGQHSSTQVKVQVIKDVPESI
jgi:hypothetical protein